MSDDEQADNEEEYRHREEELDASEERPRRLERENEDGERITVAYCTDCDAETGRWYRGSMPGEVP